MAREIWHVAVGGAQLPGEHDTAQVRDLLSRNKGKDVQVWTAGMATWADPRTQPEFQEPAQPLPEPKASAPAPVAEPQPRPTAPRAPRPSVPSGVPLPMSADELQEQAGIFKALFDTSFNTLLAPKLIKAVYLIFMVVIGLAVAGGILVSLAGFAAGFGRGLVGLVISVVVLPVVAVLYLAMVRMGLEVMMAIFKIKEYAGVLAEKARRSE